MVNERNSADGIQWNLADLYKSKDAPELKKDIDTALKRAGVFAEKHRGHLASGDMTPKELLKAIAEFESIYELMGKAESFAQLLYAKDTLDHERSALVQMVTEKKSETANKIVFFELEWLSLDDEKAREYYEDPVLTKYKHFLEAWRRFKPYKLSEKEEQLMEAMSNTGKKAFRRLFDETMGAMEVTIALQGKKKVMQLSQALSLLYDPDRDTRKAAALGITQILKKNDKLLTFIFNTLVQDHATTGKFRRYPNPMEPRNLHNELDKETVDALMDACDKNVGMVIKYYKLKKKLLGLKKLYDHDRYCPLPGDTSSITYGESKQKVLESYAAFSSEMAEIAEKFFEHNWIDAEVRKGKMSGGFSASTVSTVHPYILLNFTDKLSDMMVMAHELGHGIHQYLAMANGYFQMHTPLVTAETASVFGELLVFENILKEMTAPKAKLTLIARKIENSFKTVFRQIIMTRFEQSLHKARVEKGVLSTKIINELWIQANHKMFRDSVELSEEYGNWWSYIPHFVHTPFYCYAYAFGELVVLALYAQYRKEGASFLPKYLQMLKAGGSLSPKDLMAQVGVDMTDPNFWQGGLNMLAKYVDMVEELATKAGY